MKTGQRPLRSLPYCFALLHEKAAHQKVNGAIQN